MKPFMREEENNLGENLNTAMMRPFTRDKDERKNEDLIVEIVQPTEGQKEAVVPEIGSE